MIRWIKESAQSMAAIKSIWLVAIAQNIMEDFIGMVTLSLKTKELQTQFVKQRLTANPVKNLTTQKDIVQITTLHGSFGGVLMENGLTLKIQENTNIYSNLIIPTQLRLGQLQSIGL